jgi:hypothetical protein
MTAVRPEILPIWAEAGDKVQPSEQELQIGWPYTNIPPSRQRFNWILNNLSNAVGYLTRRGMPDWSADETYEEGDIAQYGGICWVSLHANNTNNTPGIGAHWNPWSAEALIAAHNASDAAHADIRGLIEALSSGRRDRGIVLSAWAPMQTGRLTGMTISDGGAGYLTGDVLYISIPGATEIPAWVIISGVDENGAAQSITIVNPGAFSDISAPGNAIVQQGSTTGAGLSASCSFSTGNGQTLSDIEAPMRGDAVVVLHSEVAGSGAAWVWLYADQNGDEVYNWIPAGGPTGQSSRNLPYFASGEPLPISNIGPIWHDDYNSIMTWQVFNQNGADYAGYASVLVGKPELDAQPTPRAGYVPCGASMSKTTYDALWNWAVHNGLQVNADVWVAGTVKVKDNGDGSFTVYDLRGEFLRAFDAGRGVDAGRVFGSAQGDAIRNITGWFQQWSSDHGIFQDSSGVFYLSTPSGGGDVPANTAGQNLSVTVYLDASRSVPTASQNRPRNVALLACIKF